MAAEDGVGGGLGGGGVGGGLEGGWVGSLPILTTNAHKNKTENVPGMRNLQPQSHQKINPYLLATY